MPCEHHHFTAAAQVQGITQHKRRRWRILARVTCAQCGADFRFLDASLDYPPVQDGGLTLTWPIEPDSHPGETHAPKRGNPTSNSVPTTETQKKRS